LTIYKCSITSSPENDDRKNTKVDKELELDLVRIKERTI